VTTNEELLALTPDQLSTCIVRAIEVRDFKAVEGYLHLLALKEPARAQDILDTFELGLLLAGREVTS
jgi:hypothetical protein